MRPRIEDLQTAGNALKMLISPSLCYFCIILNILRSHKVDLFGSWGGGGVLYPLMRKCLDREAPS